MIVRDDDEKRERHRRHPWNPSTRLRDAQARAERAAQRNKGSGGEDTSRATAEPAPAAQTASHRKECTHRKSAAQRLQTKGTINATRENTDPSSTRTRTEAQESDDDSVRTTREMIERAVSLAFTDAAAVGIDQSTFEDPHESVDLSASHASPGKENVRKY